MQQNLVQVIKPGAGAQADLVLPRQAGREAACDRVPVKPAASLHVQMHARRRTAIDPDQVALQPHGTLGPMGDKTLDPEPRGQSFHRAGFEMNGKMLSRLFHQTGVDLGLGSAVYQAVYADA